MPELKDKIKFGWIPQEIDPRDYAFKRLEGILKEKDVEKLPGSFSLIDKDSPIENQGNFGSCTSFSAAGALQFYDKQNGAYKNLSQFFIYFWNRYIDNGGDPTQPYNEKYAPTEDSGSTIRSTMKALQKMGDCTEDSWPYVDKNALLKPSDAAIKEATEYEVLSYYLIAENSSKIDNMKKAIYSGLPVIFGRNVPNEIYNVGKDGVEPYAEDWVGGHAQLAEAYDDNKVIPGAPIKGAFKIRNSWGPDWGDGGYEWVSYYAFQKQQTDCSVITKADLPGSDPSPTPDPTPTPKKPISCTKKVAAVTLIIKGKTSCKDKWAAITALVNNTVQEKPFLDKIKEFFKI